MSTGVTLLSQGGGWAHSARPCGTGPAEAPRGGGDPSGQHLYSPEFGVLSLPDTEAADGAAYSC